METQIGTYGDAYQDHVNDVIVNGGTTADVDVAIAEYNDLGRPDWHGSSAYYAWRAATKHVCTSCGVAYSYNDKLDGSPQAVRTCLACLQRKDPNGI